VTWFGGPTSSAGAEIKSVCNEASMFPISSRRKVAAEKDFLVAKFVTTPKHMAFVMGYSVHKSYILV